MLVRVVEENHPDLSIEVFAYGPHQVGDDLCQGLGPCQCRADFVQPLEIESLLVDINLPPSRPDGRALQHHPHQPPGGGDHRHGDHGGHNIGDRVGASGAE